MTRSSRDEPQHETLGCGRAVRVRARPGRPPPHRREQPAGDPPAIRRAHQLVLVAPSDDQLALLAGDLAHVLGVEIARDVARSPSMRTWWLPTMCWLASSGSSARRIRSLIAGTPDNGTAEMRLGVGRENVVEAVPLVAVDGPAVGDSEVDHLLHVTSRIDGAHGPKAILRSGRDPRQTGFWVGSTTPVVTLPAQFARCAPAVRATGGASGSDSTAHDSCSRTITAGTELPLVDRGVAEVARRSSGLVVVIVAARRGDEREHHRRREQSAELAFPQRVIPPCVEPTSVGAVRPGLPWRMATR